MSVHERDYDGLGYARCVHCNFTVDTEAECAGLSRCPGCGSDGIPASPAKDVVIRCNVQDLRILGMWAENHAQTLETGRPGSTLTVQRIAARIEKQLSLDEGTRLTLSGEIEELKKEFPGTTTHGIAERQDDLRPPND